MSTKKPPTPSERDAARIAALEREVAGWMDAAERFQRERDALRTRLDVTQEMLDEIAAALPAPEASEGGLAQRVKGVVSRSSTAPGLTDRDRAILAPLLAIIDAHLIDNDGGRALAAVRAVVGVARG